MRELVGHTETTVRFSEVDSMHVVWHGNYMKYLEDGREAFGQEFGMKYMDYYSHGFVTPIVHSEMDFKAPLKYGDVAVIETRLLHTPAAKIIFHYTIRHKNTGVLIAEAKTIQVFVNLEGELQLFYPDFYRSWLETKGVI